MPILVPRNKRSILAGFHPETGRQRVDIRPDQIFHDIKHLWMAGKFVGPAKTQMPFDDNFRRPHAFIAFEGVEILTHCRRIGRIYTVERRQIPIVPVKRDLFLRRVL